MAKLFILVIIILLNITIAAQTGFNSIKISGRVISSDTLQTAPYVHVINLKTGKGSVADSTGFFKITVAPGDTLIFKCMGFSHKTYIITDTINIANEFLNIVMSPGDYQIDVINVFALTRQSQFRYDFINLPPDPNEWKNQIIIPGVTKDKYQWIREDEKFIPYTPVLGGSPISFFYNKFSKEVKSVKKLQQLLQHDSEQQIIETKYSKQLLADFTGYSGIKLDTFFKYLNLSHNFLLKTNAYDIYAHISANIANFENWLATQPVTNSPDIIDNH